MTCKKKGELRSETRSLCKPLPESGGDIQEPGASEMGSGEDVVLVGVLWVLATSTA
jgi:hypothetical protein